MTKKAYTEQEETIARFAKAMGHPARMAILRFLAAHRERLPGQRFAINLAPSTVCRVQFPLEVSRLLAKYAIEPWQLIFEVTECSTFCNAEQALHILRQLQKMGVRIAIDDFGTGYSALSYLRSFPIDVVKIDRAFVRSIPEEKQECLLLDGIINLVNSLGMSLIIEGVETRDQLAYLQARQCAFIQGYLFSKPLAFDDLVTYLQRVSTHPV